MKTLAVLAFCILTASCASLGSTLLGINPLWSLRISSTAKAPNCDELKYSWGKESALNYFGKSGLCRNGANIAGIGSNVPDDPLELSWVDSSGSRHQHSIPISKLVAKSAIYGNYLRVSIDDARLEVSVESMAGVAKADLQRGILRKKVIYTNDK